MIGLLEFPEDTTSPELQLEEGLRSGRGLSVPLEFGDSSTGDPPTETLRYILTVRSHDGQHLPSSLSSQSDNRVKLRNTRRRRRRRKFNKVNE